MLFRSAFCLVLMLGASSASTFPAEPMHLPPQPAIHPAGIPAGALKLSPCIPTMGEHWANPKDLPNGPYYGVYHGKPVFSEMMLSVKQLEEGTSFENLRALPGYTIDHVRLNFEPHGHPGYPVPHYDIHAYYVSPAAAAAICPHPTPATNP